ncbi:restriction endonuclease subunit S [Staphylococcus sp. 30400_3112M30941]|nr:restriction endonuclease subunit S [Staphylococcus sp. 30403_3112M30944]MBO0945319.1 restriction endonuclease subunit S [Staphylococcus sp. 30402_3112M30943]MBO0964803.1 restriction endonuclease subunit S [Staphylococcus sp. 30400_3112M30941]MBO0965549.1 restriction endonuclease subunit S [Staphylococcus sp. 30401_3112M30942]
MSNTQKKNVPELRFPEFEGEWEEKKLGEVATFAKGKLGAKKDVSQTGVPIILYGELYTKYGAIVSKIFSKTDIPENKLKMASKNDVLIPSSGETAIDIATASCIYLNKGVAVGGDINILTPQKQDGRFISLSINGINKNELSKYAQGKTVVHLYNNDIKNLKIAFPSEFEEQVRIGDLFSKLDRQIELEEQKLELLQQQKKGYMQKIFSQELRFKDENGNDYPEWEEKKLGEIIILQNGFAFESSIFTKKGIPIIRITDINNSLVSAGTVYYPKNINIDDRFKIKKNDILMAMSGATAGKVGKYISDNPSLLNQRIAKFEMKYGTNSQFIFAYLNTKIFQQELTKLLVAGAQPNISSRDIEKISLTLPFNIEQQKIGALHSKMDYLIEIQQFKIKNLNLRKRWLLQKLFI